MWIFPLIFLDIRRNSATYESENVKQKRRIQGRWKQKPQSKAHQQMRRRELWSEETEKEKKEGKKQKSRNIKGEITLKNKKDSEY